ncbi:MAG: galactokinase [Planctomycetota bacterium]
MTADATQATDPTDIDAQLIRATERFREAFDAEPTHAAVAPGRVNLIGEHTDYNGGFVCPMAIERQTVVVGRPVAEPIARLATTAFDGVAGVSVIEGMQPGQVTWANYVAGVIAGFVGRGLVGPGAEVVGFEVAIDSTVPRGGGLSSSASLEVASATLIESLIGRAIDPGEKALLAQKAEHDFAGVPCGIMDQFISAMGEAGYALLIDCKTNTPAPVPLDDPGVSVLIIDSSKQHALTGGEYAERRAQCEAAAEAMGVGLLRDADPAMLEHARGEIDDVTYRRARHVITEDERTLAAVEGMRAGDWGEVGLQMLESHRSMRDDFEITTPHLDRLVELAMGHEGVWGSRMTGGGFGGCTVTLVATDRADDVAEAVVAAYAQETGLTAPWFVTRPAAGARMLSLD